MTQQKDSWEKKFQKEIKPYFAIWATICKKCGHIADSHYWNGGGRAENSGYDTCHICGCVDYDREKDFVDKVQGYEENGIKKFKAFISQELANQRERIYKRLDKLTDKKIAKKLADNLEKYGGKRYCAICGIDPERQRKMILDSVLEELKEK